MEDHFLTPPFTKLLLSLLSRCWNHW